MRQTALALAVVAALAIAAPAAAATILDFSFSNAGTGTIELSFDGTDYTLNSLDLKLGTDIFTAANSGIVPDGASEFVGGDFNGVESVMDSSHDFLFDFNPNSATQTVGVFYSNGAKLFSKNLKITRLAAAAVPEPATWALMLIGFGGIGWAMRRRRAGLATAN